MPGRTYGKLHQLVMTAVVGGLLFAVGCAGEVADAGGTADPPAGGDSAGSVAEAAPPASQAVEGPQKNFPGLDYLQQIPGAYRVANDHPEILEKIPCYCPCMLYGHGGVIDCYRSQHAAACGVCLEEAILAGQVIAESGADDPDAVALQVKGRYRTAIVQNYLRQGSFPNLQTEAGRAYLTECSECHQPPHPGMYTPEQWRRSLARMEDYTRQRDMHPDPGSWSAALDYLRTTSARFPATTGANYRARLQTAVDHLKSTEGAAAYYPSRQDEVLSPAWFERMVAAYRAARDIPAEALAAVELEDDPGCTNLLQCLNSGAGVVSEAAVEAVERLAAELADDD